MNAINRDKVAKPQILVKMSEDWTRDLLVGLEKVISAINDTDKKYRTARKSFIELQLRYRHPEIKDNLIELFNGKCAYCESKITHIDYGHIEHYRPKDAFPDLTFEWDNLLLSCSLCNGPTQKGNKFPEASDDGPILNPCIDDPSLHLKFIYDNNTKLASIYGKTNRGSTTETVIGLNRYDLRMYRSRWIKQILFLMARASIDDEAKMLLSEIITEDSDYLGFIQFIIKNPPTKSP